MSWMRRSLVVSALLVASSAGANGRFPASMSVTPIPGSRGLLLGTTFGVLYSPDDGATWRWQCEAAVGYSGSFDPVFAVTAGGTILAGTDYGLGISRDGGCSWQFAGDPLVAHWISDMQVGPDGAIWLATSTSGKANDVYVSRDGGTSFGPTQVPEASVFWKSLRVAPGDAQRIYVAGYRVLARVDGGTGTANTLYRSVDGGAHWMALPGNYPQSSQLTLLGVSPTDKEVVFGRTTDPDALLRSPDGGMSWATVLQPPGKVEAFAIEPDGQHAIAGSSSRFAYVSDNAGMTWTPAAQQPRMACLGSRPDGTLYSCGANFDPDHFALGKSTDHGQSWTPIFLFSQMSGPLLCPAGSVQKDVCEPMWPVVAEQFGLPPGTGGTIDAGTAPPKKNGGGCGCGVSPALALLLLARLRWKR